MEDSSTPPSRPITTPEAAMPATPASLSSERKPRRLWILAGALAILVVAAGGWGVWHLTHKPAPATKSSLVASPSPAPTTPTTPGAKATGLTLDESHNYGNKYANGLLPVGDNKFSLTSAQKGTVYLCRNNFVPASQAGAQTRGPWFTNNNTQWDITKKAHVAGSVNWTPSWQTSLTGGQRIITTNDLPDHHTGVFPVAASDPARKYDANPNTIKTQTLRYALSADPTYSQPNCMGGEVGVMLTGVALFNAFDAGGRDAGAWEVQDDCSGHPQGAGEYHYHTLSSCITDQSVHNVIGYALDGFPITGPKVGANNILTTDDLDECHGITSQITLDGKPVTMYHYVMTQDFPYSASCFRSTPIQAPQVAGGQQPGGGMPPRP